VVEETAVVNVCVVAYTVSVSGGNSKENCPISKLICGQPENTHANIRSVATAFGNILFLFFDIDMFFHLNFYSYETPTLPSLSAQSTPNLQNYLLSQS
jgi:hypothetical protein